MSPDYRITYDISHFNISHYLVADLNNQFDTGSWTTILTATFFGASDPITGRILDGRWANASVPMMTPEFFLEEGININKTFFAQDELRW